MDPRTARVVACALVVSSLLLVPARPAAAAGPTTTVGAWTRPVPGAVMRPFVAPINRYGAGHRGADLAAAPGTPVLAAGAGRVSFAGSVAGTLHVVVDHGGGLRTGVSFLATVSVRTGQVVSRGAVLGTAGGTGPDHDGRAVHFSLRVGDHYVDPMQLFEPVDLTEVVHLAPLRHEPAQHGYSTPGTESRDLADALHLPRGIPGLAPEPAPSLLARGVAAVGGALGTAGRFVGRGSVSVWHLIRDHTSVGAQLDDLRMIGVRLAAAWQSHQECSDREVVEPGGPGSGHLLFAVGGINSATDPATGAAFGLDTRALGYGPDEVGWFSYRADGALYSPPDTWGDLLVAAFRLRDQVRAFSRAHPYREVDLVAHSQGGIVVDAFLQLVYDPADPTLPPLGNAITLASPHLGAPLATVATHLRSTAAGRAALGAAARLARGAVPPSDATSVGELAEGSRLIEALWAHDFPDQTNVLTVGGTDDVVVPDAVAAAPGAEHAIVNPPGPEDHTAIPSDPAAMQVVRRFLERRPAPCVGWADAVRGAVEPVVIRRVELTAGALAAGVAGRAGRP